VAIADCGLPTDRDSIRNPQSAIRNESVLDLLTRLVDKSLVIYEEPGHREARYRLLETVRQYSLERLQEHGEEEELGTHHLAFYLRLAEAAEPRLRGPEQVEWLDRLETEHGNLRAALECSQQTDAEIGLRLAGALVCFWRLRNHLREGRERLSAVLSRQEEGVPGCQRRGPGAHPVGAARGRALCGLTILAYYPHVEPLCQTASAECLVIAREVDDRWTLAHCLSFVAMAAMGRRDWNEVRAANDESRALAREVGDKWLLAHVLCTCALEFGVQGDNERAMALMSEPLSLAEEVGDRWLLALVLHNLGNLMGRNGDHGRSRALVKQSVDLLREIGEPGMIALCLEDLAEADAAEQRMERAARLLGTAQTLREAIGFPVESGDLPAYERLVADVQAALGSEAFAAAWSQGREMSLEEAVAQSLDNSDIAATEGR
jgi:hypothetical protein